MYTDDAEGELEDEDEEKTKAIMTVFGGMTTSSFLRQSKRITDITFKKQLRHCSETEKLQIDIAALRKQYKKLRERQKQANFVSLCIQHNSNIDCYVCRLI